MTYMELYTGQQPYSHVADTSIAMQFIKRGTAIVLRLSTFIVTLIPLNFDAMQMGILELPGLRISR